MSKPVILCVDDEEIILVSLEQQLKYRFISQCDIELAENGETALELVQKLLAENIEVPLVITDQLMPGINGDELLVRIHAISPKTLKVLLTGQASADAVGNAVNCAGLYRYISKPWESADLDLTVTEALRRYFQDCKLEEQNRFLQGMNRKLEQKIAGRTAELEVNNRQLQEEVSARREAEKQLLYAKEHADFANNAKSEFLANMSHEIRTPMNAILGFTEILESKLTDEQNLHYLSAIHSAGRTLLTLINDILDLSKVEAGKIILEYVAIDPRPVFTEIKQIFSKKIAEKGLDFQVEISPALPQRLVLDDVRLHQILLNLAGNAIKFTNSGFVKLSARMVPKEGSPALCDFIFSVEDTGIGIPAGQRETIFGAFEQQKGQSHARFGGTGLGLTISKHLIELMGGEISVMGEVGKGSTFQVTLKEIEIASGPGPEAKEQSNIDPKAIRFARASILIADDVEYNREVIKAYLKEYNIECLEAADGKEAYAIAKHHHPDLVLMDIKMPVMDGLAATKKMKRDKELENIPVIAITASAMKKFRCDAEEICDAHLTKPITKVDLLSLMLKFLEHSRVVPPPPEDSSDSEKALGAEELSRLPELLALLEGKLKNIWVDLDETSSINDIEDFANLAKTSGSEYKYPPLIRWANTLLSQTLRFDVDILPDTLEKFPAIIVEIRELIQ
ncbi:MAG: response regulator [Gammaproteobacteria bacterium]|nr:response regulator [Gammaproteobacteria bacterium]